MSNKGFTKKGSTWDYGLSYAEKRKKFYAEVERSRPLHNGKPNRHAYWEDGEWHLPLMWGKPGHFGTPQPKYVNQVYEDMIRNEAILRDRQAKLKELANEVEAKRKAVVAARLTYVNKGFKKPDGGPIRNNYSAGVNKGKYKHSCDECLDIGECGSCDGCCNCICHKGTRHDGVLYHPLSLYRIQ